MLNLFEKIQFFFSAFLLFVVLVVYLVFGIETESVAYLPEVKKVPDTRPAASVDGSQARVQPSASRRDRQILDKLKKQQGLSRRNMVLEKEKRRIPKKTFKYVNNKRNWLAELNRAASSTLEGSDGRLTKLELFNIEENSLFEKFGFSEGDQVALVNGEILDFDPGNIAHFSDMAEQIFDDIESGGSASVTVIRNGKPVDIEFRLE